MTLLWRWVSEWVEFNAPPDTGHFGGGTTLADVLSRLLYINCTYCRPCMQYRCRCVIGTLMSSLPTKPLFLDSAYTWHLKFQRFVTENSEGARAFCAPPPCWMRHWQSHAGGVDAANFSGRATPLFVLPSNAFSRIFYLRGVNTISIASRSRTPASVTKPLNIMS